MALPVAVQVYSVRDDAKADLRATLTKIKEMGYDGVEFAGLYDHTGDEVRAMLDEVGLVAVSAHVPFADMRKDPKGTLETYAKIGCKYIAVPYLVEADRPGIGDFDKTVADVEMIGKAAKELGIQLLYHNHDFEFIKIQGEYALDILYNEVPSEFLQTEIDTCWVNVGGENPAAYIEKYTGRAPVVHLKDFVGSNNGGPLYKLIGIDEEETEAKEQTFEFRPVGYGVQDFKAILASAEKAGASWVVVEQDNPSMDKTPLECAKMSIEYLNGIES